MEIDGIAGWERLPVEPPATPWSFPDPLTAGRDDLVAVGGDLEPGTILGGYRRGLFPMNVNRRHLGWWTPEERGIARRRLTESGMSRNSLPLEPYEVAV